MVTTFNYKVQHDEEFRSRYTEEQEKANKELADAVPLWGLTPQRGTAPMGENPVWDKASCEIMGRRL